MLDDLIETKAAGGDVLPAAPKTAVRGLAIVGSNPTTKDAAPYGDASWKILACSPDNTPYGMSKYATALPRVDEVFEVHLPLEDPSRPFPYLKYLSEQPFVWLRDQKALKSFKGGRLYPEKELRGTSTLQKVKVQGPDGAIVGERIAEIPNHDGIFDPCQFTSSIAYMFAKSIVDAETDGIPMIGLWGIMQAAENEYVYQRPGIQYFIHEAMKRGIKVVANRESCLFDMPQWKW
jgi:hypothetical protein